MRILIADDHAVVRAGLKLILSTREGWEICAEAETGEAAVVLAQRFRPDVVVLDLNMPGISGLQATAEIKQTVPGTGMVILTCHYSATLLQAIVKAEDLGFVMKSDANRDLVSALEAVGRREPFISRHTAAALPEASNQAPLFMLLGDSELLTSQERAQVRTIARQMRHLL